MTVGITIWVFGLLFVIPLLGCFTALVRTLIPPPASPRSVSEGLNSYLGRWEYFVGRTRNGAAILVGAGLLLSGVLFEGESSYIDLTEGGVLLGLVLVSRIHRRLANAAILNLLKDNPDIHPVDLFEYLYHQKSVWPPRGPIEVRTVPYPALDFRDLEQPLPNGKFALMHCFVDTGCIASLTIALFKRMHGQVALNVFDSLARLWSSRCALLLRLRLQVTGVESLKELSHQSVIVLNHESLLDFAMGFYVVGGADTGRGNRLATRFIAAKDHFKDNFFLHSVIGMGRAMEQAGMIFVDRKVRGGGQRVILESVEAMRESGVDVAIFPQGTRAIAHFDADGLPTGAGFYTTTRGPTVGVGHFKSGTSRIVSELSKHQDVNILLVSIQGAATAIPAKRFDIYPGATIRYHIAPPITVEKGTNAEAETLNHRIELALRNNAHVHDRLLARWQIECHRDQAAYQALESALAPWDQAQEPVPFAVLDAILGRTPNERPALLAQFEETALSGATTEQWIEFRTRIGGR